MKVQKWKKIFFMSMAIICLIIGSLNGINAEALQVFTNWKAKYLLAGVLHLEFVDTQNHSEAKEPGPHFIFQSFDLCSTILLSEDIFIKTKIKFKRASLLVEKSFITFDIPCSHSFLSLGINKRFIKPRKEIKRYPLAGNAFWRKSETGLFAGGRSGPFYYRFSYTNGFQLDKQSITVDNSFPMLQDDWKKSDYGSYGHLGSGLGFDFDLKQLGRINSLGFFYLSKMNSAEISSLIDPNKYTYPMDDNNRYRYGFNLDYSVGGGKSFCSIC